MDKQKQIDDFFGLNPNPSEEPKKGEIKETIAKRNGNKSKFKLIPKVLSTRERYLVLICSLIFIGSLLAIPVTTYNHYTRAIASYGGSFSEGVVGEPRHINPLLAQTNDVDRDLVSLIYSGLLRYNSEGVLVPDLAKSYEISPDGLSYTVYLRDDAKWHDGRPVTTDDVLFTIQTAQNSDYGSLQRINWVGVNVEKADSHTIIFRLNNKYAQFLNNLSLQILPKHVWQDIRPINFALSELNVKPIGSGPYQFEKFQRDKLGKVISYTLASNRDFYLGRPHINEIEIKFYNSEDEMTSAYNRNEIENISLVSTRNSDAIKFKQRLNFHQIKMPRYFALFLNQNQSKALSDKNVRLALAHGSDRGRLIDEIFGGNALIVNSPMIGEILGANTDIPIYNYDFDRAKEILKTAGWDKTDENGILMKGNEKLSLRLTTSIWPELTSVAAFIKEDFKKLGIEIIVEVLTTPELQQAIKDRNYQILLFGEILNTDPDPFTFWHSSGKKDPGLNLALYDNRTADTILEEARQILNPDDRAKKYDDFQKIVVEDIPALFLYSTYYTYAQTKNIQGFDNRLIPIPSARFANIQDWYIETKRIGN